jgi:hypothetical protein
MSKEAMKLALEGAANYIDVLGGDSKKYRQVLEEALTKQKQGEPDLIECGNCHEGLADMEHVCKKCLGAGWVNNPKQEQGGTTCDEPVAIVVASEYEDGSYAGNHLEWRGRNEANDFPVGTKLYTTPPKQEQGEPVAWLWKHINRKGEELNAGLSFEKVEPTNNTFWMNPNDPRLTATEVQPLYTTPQQRKPLTFERVYKLWLARFDTNEYDDVFMNFARAIEAAHGIKENT